MKKLFAMAVTIALTVTMMFADLVSADPQRPPYDMYAATPLQVDVKTHIDLSEVRGVWLSFTASESGFYSLEDVYEYQDRSYVYLYDSNGLYCGFNDNSGSYADAFKITYYFEAGSTYYYYCSDYDYYHEQYDVILTRETSGFLCRADFVSERNARTFYIMPGCSVYIGADINSDVTMSFIDISGGDTDQYSFKWLRTLNGSRGYYHNSDTDSSTTAFTVTTEDNQNQDHWLEVTADKTYNFFCHISYSNQVRFDDDVLNAIVRRNTESDIRIPELHCVDPSLVDVYCSEDHGNLLDERINHYPEDGVIRFPGTRETNVYEIQAWEEGHNLRDTVYAFLFVRDDDNSATASAGQSIDVSLHFTENSTFYDFDYIVPECMIYSFTPEYSGSYTISSSDLVFGNPYVALFDSSDNCIGYNDNAASTDFLLRPTGSDNWNELYPRLDVDFQAQHDTDYLNFALTVDLQAGQTYSIVAWSTFMGGKGFYNRPYVTGDAASYKLNITCNDAPAAQPGNPGGSGSSNPANTSATPTPAIPSPAPSSHVTEGGVSGFVERLYTVALGRTSDPAGKQDWIDAVTLRGETGASCARGFLYSPEFLNKQCTTEEFVAVLYRTFFNREPDQAGFNSWVEVLNNGTSKEEVIEGFINSTEWANLCLHYGIRSGGTGTPNVEVEPNQATIDFATRLYTTCLGRAADQNGLMAWARQLANQRDSGTGAAHGFFFSSEFTNQNVSNDEYVNRLYRTFMGREADEAGFNAWVAQLNEGVSREEVFNGFAQSPEFTRICADYGIIR